MDSGSARAGAERGDLHIEFGADPKDLGRGEMPVSAPNALTRQSAPCLAE
jgi:hypothetical protein